MQSGKKDQESEGKWAGEQNARACTVDRNQYTIYTVGQLFSASDCDNMLKDSFVTGSECNANVISGAQERSLNLCIVLFFLFLLATYDSQNECCVTEACSKERCTKQ